MAFEDIQKALEKANPITSIALHRLFKGKSVNPPAFLLTVMKHEKLLQPMKGKKCNHELVDPGAFLAKVDKLMASSSSAKATPKKTPRKSTKTTPTKKKASVSRRKSA